MCQFGQVTIYNDPPNLCFPFFFFSFCVRYMHMKNVFTCFRKIFYLFIYLCYIHTLVETNSKNTLCTYSMYVVRIYITQNEKHIKIKIRSRG